MRRSLFIALCILIPGICQAAPSKEVTERINTMNDAAITYNKCLLTVFESKVKIIVDLRAMADAIIQECKHEREAFKLAHQRLTAGLDDISEVLVTDIENKIIGERKAKHDISIQAAMLRIAMFRGLVEFCPLADIQIMQKQTALLMKNLPIADAAYHDQTFFKNELDKYYNQYVTERISKSDTATWCHDRKVEAEKAGIAKEFFK